MKIGIDLGTTNCCVAYIDKEGNPQIVPNDEGDRTTPSVIFFDEDHVVVGMAAKEEAGINPENTISYIKRQMGDESFKFPRGDDYLTPEDLSAIILKKLKNMSEDYLGEEVDSVVITVPAYFNDAQRKATQDAANIAGLKVLKIINEPTAAALAYGVNNKSEDQNIMIYDLGGGTFDAVAMELRGGNLRVLSTNGNKQLGGFDFDNALLGYVIEKIEEKYDVDLYDDEYAIEYLREKVEDAKKALSSKSKTNIVINYENIRDKIEITQEIFNDLIRSDVRRTCDMMNFTLEDAGLTWDQVDKTIFVGGSSRIKLVREMVEELIGKKPSLELNPDEVVAIGAAIQANLIESDGNANEHLSGIEIIDVNSHSLGMVALNEEKEKINYIIIEKDSPLPCSVTSSFLSTVENQGFIDIGVVEGEEEDLNYCSIVSEMTIRLPEVQRPIGSEFLVTYSYDTDGIIHVDIFDSASQTFMQSIDIERKSNLSKQEIIEKKDKISNLEIE